jgi:hypothetical protein
MYDANTGDIALHSKGHGDTMRSAGEMFGGQAADMLSATTFGLTDALGMKMLYIPPLDGADTARLRSLYRLQNPKEPITENLHNQNVKVMRWLESKFLYLQPENYGRGSLNNVMMQLKEKYGVLNPGLYNLWQNVGNSLFTPGFQYNGMMGTIDFSNIKAENLVTNDDRKKIASQIKDYWTKHAKPNVPLSIAKYAPYSSGQSGVGPFKPQEIENLKNANWVNLMSTYGAPGTDGWNGKPEFIQRIKDYYIGEYLRKGGTQNKNFVIPSHKKYDIENKPAAKQLDTRGLSGGMYRSGGDVFDKSGKVVRFSGPKFANGTKSAPGGMALIGERGPEIMHVPKGAEIIPNHKLPAFAKGTMGATAALLTANNNQLEQLANKIASAIVNASSNGQPQNINLIVDGRQLNNVQYRRQQNRIGARPNDLV